MGHFGRRLHPDEHPVDEVILHPLPIASVARSHGVQQVIPVRGFAPPPVDMKKPLSVITIANELVLRMGDSHPIHRHRTSSLELVNQ